MPCVAEKLARHLEAPTKIIYLNSFHPQFQNKRLNNDDFDFTERVRKSYTFIYVSDFRDP